MSDSPLCTVCGAPRSDGDAGGDCPRCLLDLGFHSGAAQEDGLLEPEQLAGHFPGLEIVEVIGRGGMGVVYKARQRELGRTAALKVLLPELADDGGFAERFSREARALAQLNHPNIVTIYEFGETDGLYFLLMEYVDGTTLRQAMRAGALEAAQALAIVPQICDALQYAHDRGVVHRDIKPENVLLDRAGTAKIVDFGLAKLVETAETSHTLTRADQVMGTVHYMAPEQIRTPGDVDHRADIYSLGVVFYELLTGNLPIGRFEPPSKTIHVDVRLDEVVLRTLEYERDRRYQRAADVKTGIHSITSSPEGVPPASDALSDGAAPAPSRLSRLAVAGALCLPGSFLMNGAAGVLPLMMSGVALIPTMSLLSLASGVTAVTGSVLSVAGWINISRSRGRLHGKWLAVLGSLLPLLVALPAVVGAIASIGSVDFGLLRGEPELELVEVDPYASYPEDEVVAPARREDVDALVDRLLASPGPLGDLDAMATFYSPVGVGQLRAQSDGRLENGGRLGRIGLPMVPRDVLDAPLAEFTKRKIDFPQWGPAGYRNRTAAVTLSLPGGQGVVTRVVRHEGKWYFATEQVRFFYEKPPASKGSRDAR